MDRGRWTRDRNGTLEYLTTKCEIAAKRRLFRAIKGLRGEKKRASRDGDFAVATTFGI